MKMMIMILMMMAVTPAGAGTLYVDSGVNRQLKTAGEWNTGSLTGIARPTKLWIFASGVGYDKTGANYNQYGSVAETNAFQDGGAPLLCEGMLAPHQSAELFDGATTYLTKNVADPPVTQTTFTIAAWAMSFAINEVGQGQQAVFLQRDNVANSDRPLILVSINSNNGSNYPRLVICSTSGSQQVLSGEEVLSYGQWHFLAGVCDKAGEDSIKLYADGSIIARVKENQAGNYTTGLNSIYIGRLVNSAGDQGYLNGAMCWLAIWDGAALTKAQLDSVRAVTRPTGTAAKPYPSIQSAVRMADGLGTTTLLLNSGYYQETLQILNDSLTISAANTAFGSRPVMFGGSLNTTLSGNIAVWVQAKTILNYIDIRGYAGRGVVDSTHTPANYGDQFDHLTIDSCLVGIRLNAASIAAIYNCTIDGEEPSAAATKGIQSVGAAMATLRNNIITQVDTVFAIGADVAAFVQTNNASWAVTSNGAYTPTFTALNLFFTNADGLDYRMRRHSKLIDKGAVYTGVVYLGKYPDVGAWETIGIHSGESRLIGWCRAAWGR